MTSRPSAPRSRPLVAGLVALMALTLGIEPAVAKAPPSGTGCQVKDLDTGATFSNVQDAVAAASTDDWLTVQGTCVGPTTVAKDLSFRGVRTRTSGEPTLRGDGTGPVLAITSKASVVIKDLTILGTADSILAYDGGGIVNGAGATLTLRSVVVSGFTTAAVAGAILNNGTLRLRGSTALTGNAAGNSGGAIFSDRGVVTLSDSSTISANSAPYGGGIVNMNGTLTMNGSSSIRDNSATVAGAGVYNKFGGAVLTMSDTASIRNNSGAGGGGGVYNDGTLTMSGSSSITGNSATVHGGGVYDYCGTRNNVVEGGNVSSNTPDNVYLGC